MYSKIIKPLFDFILAFKLILLLSPLGLLLMLLQGLFGPSGFFFTQKRQGYKGRFFTIYKFKTMNDQRDASGQLLPDAQRLSAWGIFLRKSNLDELPQLINVLRGDLSFVGPRPLLPEYDTLYSTEERRRMEVKPGITGWAQIHGRNDISWKNKFKLDLYYVQNQSFYLDIKILVLTFWSLLSLKGYSGDVLTDKYNGKN